MQSDIKRLAGLMMWCGLAALLQACSAPGTASSVDGLQTDGAQQIVGAQPSGTTMIAGRTPSGATDLSSGPRQVIEHPTAADLAAAGPLSDRVLGRADAPLTVIEYASLTCPHCRAFHTQTFAQVKKAYIDTGKIRWILREFPIGHTSGTAWIVTRCAPEKDYFELYQAYLEQQSSWVAQEVRLDPIYAVAAKFGMSRQEFDKCLSNQSIQSGLLWVKERGRTLGVSGTPTFFVGENKVRGELTFDQFRALADPQLGGNAAALPQTIQ